MPSSVHDGVRGRGNAKSAFLAQEGRFLGVYPPCPRVPLGFLEDPGRCMYLSLLYLSKRKGRNRGYRGGYAPPRAGIATVPCPLGGNTRGNGEVHPRFPTPRFAPHAPRPLTRPSPAPHHHTSGRVIRWPNIAVRDSLPWDRVAWGRRPWNWSGVESGSLVGHRFVVSRPPPGYRPGGGGPKNEGLIGRTPLVKTHKLVACYENS